LKLGIVVPVQNEATALPRLLASFAAQTQLDAVACIAIVDGESDDGSPAICASWQDRLPMLRVVGNPRRITPVAFNLGIDTCLGAGCEAVLLLSGHSWIAGDFVANLLAILADGAIDIAGSIHNYPPPGSGREAAVQAFIESVLGRRAIHFSSMTAPTPTDVAYCPAIRARVFDRIGRFDESMVRNQDNDFTTRARAAGLRIVTFPSLRYTYLPRATAKQLFRQMKGNGFWVGQRPRVHGLRHFAPSLFWLAALASLAVAIAGGGWWWLLPLLSFGPYLAAVVAETVRWHARNGASPLLLPALFVGAHASYAAGTLSGLLTPKPAR
jgi:succinoglycan biosynthesis protein ExoA